MVDIETNKNRIQMAQFEMDHTKSTKRRNDLKKYIWRLKKEISECYMHLNGTYGNKAEV